MCGACSPQPSAETTALEPYLLTVSEVGADFTEQRGGQVSTGIGHVCPETDVSVGGFGAVKAWLTRPNDDEVVEVFNDCDGIEWDYQGEALVIEIVDAPVVADDQIAVRPSDTDCADCYTIYVHHGDVIAIISVPDHSDTYDEIIAKAIDKLPDSTLRTQNQTGNPHVLPSHVTFRAAHRCRYGRDEASDPRMAGRR
jgi:hypothetical protein